MRSTSTVTILAGAVALAAAGVLGAAPSAPADGQANIPVREVVLFSSGVGYFEHDGQVTGDSATVLHFKTDQINDILKSLVLEDLDKGKISAVTYPSQGPLDRTLRSFQLDLTANPSLSDLLNQLRGARVSVTLAEGGRSIVGTVMGVEKQQRPVGGKDHSQVMNITVVNLVNETGIEPVELSRVSDVKIEDPELQKELLAALASVAQARDKDKKPVEIHFAGKGQRRVRIGYVVETPVWKTSYRLILPEAGDAPATHPAVDQDQKKAAGKEPHWRQASLQGWAIVENQTDSDWKNVQLSLVSGRPISFIEDLYQPLYIPRPVVQPQLYASLLPQTYEGGIEEKRSQGIGFGHGAADSISGAPSLARQMQVNDSFASGAAPSAAPASRFSDASGKMDITRSIASIASAAKVGDLFQYAIGDVSIQRQQSAMLPIVTDPIDVEKLSIYNQTVLASNPLLGARLKNTTGKYLLQGPVTVLAGGSYAGDASLGDVPPGQERLISYGIDQEIIVHASDQNSSGQILTGKIVKGVLELTYKQVLTDDYVAEDKSDKPRKLLVEVPRQDGWTLVENGKPAQPAEPAGPHAVRSWDSAAPIETTNALYRFQGMLQPHQPSKLTVSQQHTERQFIGLAPLDIGALTQYQRTGPIPADVKTALAKAIQLKQALFDTQRQIQEQRSKISDITQEQNRIRENMKAVSPSSDYYKRLLSELDAQETTIQNLQKQIQTLQAQEAQENKALETYLSNLNVG